MTIMYGYIYDADGDRVAKGTISSWSCDPSVNGFSATANYVLNQAGHQLSRFAPDSNGNIALDYTNVYAAGTLMATYDGSNLHFYLNDWLGTRRVQTNYSGVVEQDCMSLPYGDSETCGPEPAENLYTGKARDAETAGGVSPFGVNQGNDYFGARYYNSVMGRWLSPDYGSGPVPYASFTDPQSLNLYGYVGDNPLAKADLNGHCCDAQTIQAIIDFLNAHPAIGKAASKIVGSLSVKVNAGIGLEESIGAKGFEASAALSSTVFFQLSNKGVTTGGDFKYGASIDSPLTGRLSRGRTIETISKENGVDLPEPGKKEVSNETGIGNFTNSKDTFSIGDETGAGPDLGAELDVNKAAFKSGVNDLGHALIESVAQEASKYIEQLQFSSKCTPSGCETQ